MYAPFLPGLLGTTHAARTLAGHTDYTLARHGLYQGHPSNSVALVNVNSSGQQSRWPNYVPLGAPIRLHPFYMAPRAWLAIELPAPGLVYCDLLGELLAHIECHAGRYYLHPVAGGQPRIAPDIELITVALPVALVAAWQVAEAQQAAAQA